MGNALDFRAGVAHGVEGFFGAGEMAIGGHTAAARLAKVNVAGEFANDQDVQASHQFGLEAGGVGQLLVANGGAEVGKQAHVLAQPQNGLLRTQGTVQGVVFPVAHGAEQHRIRGHGQLQGGLGQRVAMRVKGGTTHQGGLHLEGQVQNLEHLDGFRHDFGADAIAGKNCNFHDVVGVSVRVRRCGPARAWWPDVGLRRREFCRHGARSGQCRQSH